MIRFGLRLTLAGGREAAARLVVIAAAVAVGVALLLTTLAGINGVNTQNARYAWLETGASPSHSVAGVDPLWWQLTPDTFSGDLIGRVDVAATGPHSPVPPGIPRLPGPGEFYASPALSRLLASTSAAELADRYPGRQVGTIGAAALPGPDTLVIVVGRTPGQLAHLPGVERVSTISTTPPSQCNGACYSIGIDANGIDLILSIVAAALLFPVLIFIGTATRLSAARREQRFAALRLVGATPRQVATISTVESTVAAALGVGVGFGLFFAVRPAVALLPFTGSRVYTSDLTLGPLAVVLVVLGVPIAAAVVARLALRRVIVSPLGVSRRVTPRPPRPWRLLPLAAGLAELTWFAVAGRPETTNGQIWAFLAGILVTMAGLVVAGPWLTLVGSRVMVRRANGPASLIAGRRLSDDPGAGFRAISGLALALFVGSVAVGCITTINAYDGDTHASAAQRATLVDRFTDYSTRLPSSPVTAVPADVLAGLRAVPGVQAITVVHADYSVRPGPDAFPGLVSCAALARMPALGRCPAGAEIGMVPDIIGNSRFASSGSVWPVSTAPAERLDGLPVQNLAVTTDGSAGSLERARTLLERDFPGVGQPTTIAEEAAQSPGTRQNAGYQQLADVVVLTSLPIAGCTLAVSIVAGLNDRKRPFSLLRLAGSPLAMLRRIVVLESAVPLLVVAVAATGTGFLTAYLFLTAQLDQTLQPPGLGYYLVVAAGLIASLAVLASTLPVLRRITGPESARAE